MKRSAFDGATASDGRAGLIGRHEVRRAEGSWTTLPPGSSARLLVPTGSRDLVRAGLLLYQPMTGRGRLAWQFAWRVAAAGVFRILPRATPPELPERLVEMVPTGGTVAVAQTNVPHRSVVLILDRFGALQSLAKLARDERGRIRLAAEATALSRAKALLSPPLTAPQLLAFEDDFLVMEAVTWRLRHSPWALPAEVAGAMGHFHHTSGHPSHGDFAPWNLMLTDQGWMLLDWEDFEQDSVPFADIFHYLVQAHSLLGRPHREELLAGLRGTGWVGRSLDAYAEAAHVRLDDSSEALAAYLTESADRLRQDPLRRGALKGVEARHLLLSALADRG